MGLFSDPNVLALFHRMGQLEQKVDAIMARLGVEMPPDGLDDIRDLVAAGKALAAIKAYRDRTGANLFDAKVAVDEMARQMERE